MRPACAVASRVLDEVSAFIVPGLTTREVDLYAASRIKHHGAKSAFLGYRNYPCNICISINDEVVHGLANDRRIQFGDLVSLDVGVVFRGYVGDTARTVAAGGCSLEAQRLMDVTEHALDEGIAQAIAGNRVTTFRARSRITWKAMATVLSANLLGMASGARSMKTPSAELCGPEVEPGAGAGYDTGNRADGQRRQARRKNLERRLDSRTQDGSLSAILSTRC